MNEEPPQGNNGGVVTAEQQGVVPAAGDVLDQATAIADNAGAQELTGTPPSPTEQTTMTLTPEQMDAEMKKGAEAGRAILEPAPGPAKEFEGTSAQPLNPANPIGTPDSASLNATHQEMVDAKKEAQVAEKKGGIFGFGFIKKLSPIRAETVDRKVDDKKTPPIQQPAQPSPGLGLSPAPNSVEQVPSVASANSSEALSNPSDALSVGQQQAIDGQTKPVPGVSPEAQAAVATASKTLGESITDAQPAEAAIQTNENQPPPTFGTDVAGQPITEERIAQAPTGMPGMPTPGTEATVSPVEPPMQVADPNASVAEMSPQMNEAMQGAAAGNAVVEPAPVDAHPDIVGYDKGVAQQSAQVDNANAEENKVEAEAPDLLAVDQTNSQGSTENQSSTIPTFTPTSETTNAAAAQSNLPEQPAVDNSGNLPISAVSTPPQAEDASKWNSANFPGAVQGTEAQGKADSSLPAEPDNQAVSPLGQGLIEAATAVQPQVAVDSVQTATDTPAEVSAPSLGTTNSSESQTTLGTTPTSSSGSETVTNLETVTSPVSPVSETVTPSADNSAEPAPQGPVAVASAIEPPEDHVIQVGASPAAASEQSTGLEPAAAVPPSNVSGISADVAPGVQTQAQVEAAKSGIGPIGVVGSEPQGPEIPGNVSAIRPDVQIQPNDSAPAETTAQDQAA